MKTTFPANCLTEASRIVFCEELEEQLRLWHNKRCFGKTAAEGRAFRLGGFAAREKSVLAELHIQNEAARVRRHWQPTLKTAIVAGSIVYPATMNPNNEGSKTAFLLELLEVLRSAGSDMMTSNDVRTVEAELETVRGMLITNRHWSPNLTDIA